MQAVNTLAERNPLKENTAGTKKKPRYDVAKNSIPRPYDAQPQNTVNKPGAGLSTKFGEKL